MVDMLQHSSAEETGRGEASIGAGKERD